MGGERASTTRMRMNGKVCCFCRSSLPQPYTGRETLCAKCEEQRTPKRKVYLHFALEEKWICRFIEAGAQTPIPRKLALDDPAKIFEMAERGRLKMTLENRQAIEQGIRYGKGIVCLELTDEQLAKLKRR